MKKLSPRRRSRGSAFTLIELLIVIAIIAVLAALLVPVTGRISILRMKSVARSELQQISTAIEAYKAKYGFYPPDATNVLNSPLYFELVGSILTNDATKGGFVFLTLDSRKWIATNALYAGIGVNGMANSSTSPRATDERPAPMTFLKDIKPDQIGTRKGVPALMCSQEWDKPGTPSADIPNPWRYNSSSPTNNPGTYDLWVDLYIDGKTNRISNWSKQPIVL